MMSEIKLSIGHWSIPGGSGLRRLELELAGFEFLYFTMSGRVQSAGPYKFDYASQLVSIEPGAVALADINDNI
jgi:hypothetical protein